MVRIQLFITVLSLLAFPACFKKLELNADAGKPSREIVRSVSTTAANLYVSRSPFGSPITHYFFSNPVEGENNTRALLDINNLGQAAATDLEISVSNAAYSVDRQACPSTLPAGAGCLIFVTFTPPNAAPSEPNHLAIRYNDGTSERTLSISLSDESIPDRRPSLATSLLPGQGLSYWVLPAINPPQSTRKFILRNEGASEATNLQVSATHASFSVQTCTSLQPNQSCPVFVTFTPPSAQDDINASLEVSSDEGVSLSVGLTAKTNAFPVALLRREDVHQLTDFGPVRNGEESDGLQIRLRNVGATPATDISVNFPQGTFLIEDNQCSSLASNSTCTFVVKLAPIAEPRGEISRDLQVCYSADDVRTCQSPAHNGTFTGAILPSFGRLVRVNDDGVVQTDNSGLSFGDVALGESKDLRLHIRNDGQLDASRLFVAGFGQDSSAISITENICGVLAEGERCSFSVRFTPRSLGSLAFELRVHGAGIDGQMLVLPLTGAGIGQAVLAAPALQFDEIQTGRTQEKRLTVRNSGNVAATSVRVLNSPGIFTVSAGCSTLQPGDTCQLPIEFRAPAPTPRVTETLELSYFDGNDTRTLSVSLSGSSFEYLLFGAGPGGGAHVMGRKAHHPQELSKRIDLFPYPGTSSGGVFVAQGDLNGDGIKDIVVGPQQGHDGQVVVYNGRDLSELFRMFPYSDAGESHFQGGVRVAMGDVNGDGYADIVTAPGPGLPPAVRIFLGNATGRNLTPVAHGFPAYAYTFTGGVYVAVGYIDEDNKADIITGAGFNGGSHVRVFRNTTGVLIPEQDRFVFDGFYGGVRVAAGRIDGDDRDDIIVGAGHLGGPHMKVYSAASGELIRSYFAFTSDVNSGIFVGAADINRDGQTDILSSVGNADHGSYAFPGHVVGLNGNVPRISGVRTERESVFSFFPFSPEWLGGVSIAGF